MEVPAGFRQESILQHQVLDMTNSTTFLPESSDLSADILDSSLSDSSVQNNSGGLTQPDSLPNNSSPVLVPILQCVDKVSSHLPSQITFTEGFIRVSVGYCRIDTIKSQLQHYIKKLFPWILFQLTKVILPPSESQLEILCLYLDLRLLER